MTVPKGAQQVLLFLAPQTSGDFKTLVQAVRGRPSAFVRASQDLNQASLDRSRLTSYLAAVIALDQADPILLKEAAPPLARSLAIKVDEKCLDRTLELQAPCLTQGQDSLILNDGHSTSMVEALKSGPASDLAMEASFAPQLSYGYYSPYLASVLDIRAFLNRSIPRRISTYRRCPRHRASAWRSRSMRRPRLMTQSRVGHRTAGH